MKHWLIAKSQDDRNIVVAKTQAAKQVAERNQDKQDIDDGVSILVVKDGELVDLEREANDLQDALENAGLNYFDY